MSPLAPLYITHLSLGNVRKVVQVMELVRSEVIILILFPILLNQDIFPISQSINNPFSMDILSKCLIRKDSKKDATVF